jgi:hypothetical protein
VCVCVCVCVCVFFLVFLSLSLSISNHFSWRVCNLMTFFFWFSLQFFHKTNHLLTTNSQGILQYRSTATNS